MISTKAKIDVLTATGCIACRAVAYEVQKEYEQADKDTTIESGSFRLSGNGKQEGLRRVPYRGSELHIASVLETICDRLSSRYTRFSLLPDAFVLRAEATKIENVDTIDDCAQTRALNSVCATLVDGKEDEVRKALAVSETVWTEVACGTSGILAQACDAARDPGDSAHVLAAARANMRNESESKGGKDESMLETGAREAVSGSKSEL